MRSAFRMRDYFVFITALLFIHFFGFSKSIYAVYPQSAYITGVEYDWANAKKGLAPGSDNFPVTWGADGNVYTSWGDGGGFGGSNTDGRVSLGYARIGGNPPNVTTTNIYGGKNPLCPGGIVGKSYGLVDISGTLYSWISPGSNQNNFTKATLYKSTSSPLGCTWTSTGVEFTQSQNLILPSILQFGQGYTGAPDSYVYMYATRLKDSSGLVIQRPGETDLIRVPKTQIENKASYEFFTGLDANNNPMWSADVMARQPVFEEAEGVGWAPAVVAYNLSLNRYLLTVDLRGSGFANYSGRGFGIYEAEKPWGPWKTVAKYSTWTDEATFFYNFSTKWAGRDPDGINYMWLIYSGANSTTGQFDSYNMVKVRFITSNDPTSAPTPTPTGPTATPSPTRTPTPTAPAPTNPPEVDLLISDFSIESMTNYGWDTLAVGKTAYTDRAYTFSTVPAAYVGRYFLRTANGDKSSTLDPFIAFVANDPMTVFVTFDSSKLSTLPSWLATGWTDTLTDISTTDRNFRVFSRHVGSGESMTLGGNSPGGSMYNVILAPDTLSPTPSPTTVPSIKPGDADDDGDVDIFDYNTVLSNFGTPTGANRGEGDLDGDGDVDIFDYNEVIGNFGR